MDQVFNDPIISHFFQSVKETNKFSALKELILLGIHAVSERIHKNGNAYCSCQCNNFNIRRNQHRCTNQRPSHSTSNKNLTCQIQEMRHRIDQLSKNVNNHFNTKQNINNNCDNAHNENKERKDLLFKNQFEKECSVKTGTRQFRHHLDDSEVRKALINPYAKQSPIKKGKKQEAQKMHQLQKEKDQQQIRNLKHQGKIINDAVSDQQENETKNQKTKSIIKMSQRQNQIGNNSKNAVRYQKEDSNANTKKNWVKQSRRTNRNNTLNNAQSKIKSLVQKDKQKSKKSAFMKKSRKQANYCQFQYSDEEQFQHQAQQLQKEHQRSIEKECPVHPQGEFGQYSQNSEHQQSRDRKVFKQSYKQSRKRMKQNLRQLDNNDIQQSETSSDAVSQSSSFSKFSMNSKREIGKISRMKK